MVRTCCDSCGSDIDTTAEWFGVDHWFPDAGDDDSDEDEDGENTYHFCSAGCMSSWAFGEGLQA